MVIIPCRPSPHDLRAVGSTLDIVESADKPFAFVINAAVPRSTIAQEASRALAQHGKVAPVTLHHRIDFAASIGAQIVSKGNARPSAPEDNSGANPEVKEKIIPITGLDHRVGHF